MTLTGPLRTIAVSLLLSLLASADGTRQWTQSKYDEFEKGTATGVAINSDGSLSLAPSFTALYTSASTYLWDLAADSEGNVYAAAGSPARVYRITPDGKASVVFAPQELSVQAIATDRSGAIYAATSPDGKIYKIQRGGGAAAKPADTAKASVQVDSNYSASVFFEPKTKYIWALAFDQQGRLYAGTGDRGEVFRIDASGKGSVFFKSDEAQIRVLAFDKSGNLIAGTDGSGLIYRITPQGEGFVLYSTPKKEITALAVDRQGNIFAAGAGDKRVGAPQAPTGPSATGAPGAQVPTIVIQAAPSQPAAGAPAVAAVPFPGTVNLGGSEVYLLAPDGALRTIWSSKDDVVYALAFDGSGRLIAGTGNKGKLYAIGERDYSDLTKASANQVTAFAKAPKGGLYAATSNLGKVFVIGPGPVNEGTYESDTFDARIFSKWGRPEVRGTGNFELFARSGNVDNPDRNWSAWKKVDYAQSQPVEAPSARFIQWKAVLHAGSPAPVVNRVAINYLPKNVAPEVDEVTVSVGSRVPASTRTSNTSDSGFESAIPTVSDKHTIAVKWKAHDANDDVLAYSVYYRGDGETQWKKLREDLTDRYANLEADLFPDGGYTIRVVASDLPAHSPSEALTGEKISDRFEVDNTPPKVEITSARIEGGKVHVVFHATDNYSPISRAEISIDADDWQTAEPVGQISDYKVENYDVTFDLPPADPKEAAVTEHLVVVRAFDRYDNVGVAKTVVKAH